MTTPTMDQILDELDVAHQRATYGAVAALVGSSPRALMTGRERDHRHSWVVSRKNGKPTGYEEALMHPALTTSERIIESRQELQGWLASRGVLPAAAERAA